MDEQVIAFLVALAVSVATGVATVIGVRVSRARMVTDTAIDLLDPLRDRVGELEEEMREVREELEAERRERKLMHRWALTLRAQVVDAGLHPVELEEIMRLEKRDNQ